jgi:hypothetical protein
MAVAEKTVAEPKTKTVRLPIELANMLQTIASLKEEMGEKFRPVEYLTGLVGANIRALHAETVRQYADRGKSPKPPKK